MLQKFSILFLFRFKTQSAIKVFDLKLEWWTYNYMCISIFFHLKDRPSEGGARMEQESGAKSPAASKVLSWILQGFKMYCND